MRNSHTDKVIIFDFDGVICDSTEECLISGYNAWLMYRNKKGFVTKAEEIPQGLARYFRSWRGFVRTSGEYFVVFSSYQNSEIKGESDFDERCKIYQKEMDAYEKLFFECRAKLQDKGINHWIGLHRIYDGIPRNFKKIMDIADVFVVTGKDKDSVTTFLKHMGIVFDESNIYGKKAACNKVAAIKKVTKVTQKKWEDIIFLDDNINHLLEPQQKGCKVYMAGWGYHTNRQLQLARDKKISILGLKDWAEKLQDNI